MSAVNDTDLSAAESEPLNSDVSADVDYPHLHQAVVKSRIERTPWQQLATDIKNSTVQQLTSINALLIFLPLGFGAGTLKANAVVVSTFNFFAIIPLSALVSDSSDKLCDYWGHLIGELVNATLGNTVELTVGILAIHHNEIHVAQSTMLGSILSDILAILGGCLIAAARKSGTLKFNGAVADALSSLMIITSMALILPTILYSTLTKQAEIGDMIQSFSRATAVVLLAIYLIYLYFQLRTHKEIFLDAEHDVDAASSEGRDQPEGNGSMEQESPQEDGSETSSQALYTATVVLAVSVLAIIVCTHYLIDSLNDTVKSTPFSKTFIATILIPIASNAPECSAVIIASRKKRINYAIGVIVGSILQIALFVLPILVIMGWAVDKPMTLYFEISQTSILFLSVLMVNHLLRGGEYTYLHGIMLLSLYAMVVVAMFILPVEQGLPSIWPAFSPAPEKDQSRMPQDVHKM